MHTHHCEVCGVAVAACDTPGCDVKDANFFCTLHHPDPQHRKELVQPSKRTVVTLPESK